MHGVGIPVSVWILTPSVNYYIIIEKEYNNLPHFTPWQVGGECVVQWYGDHRVDTVKHSVLTTFPIVPPHAPARRRLVLIFINNLKQLAWDP